MWFHNLDTKKSQIHLKKIICTKFGKKNKTTRRNCINHQRPPNHYLIHFYLQLKNTHKLLNGQIKKNLKQEQTN